MKAKKTQTATKIMEKIIKARLKNQRSNIWTQPCEISEQSTLTEDGECPEQY